MLFSQGVKSMISQTFVMSILGREIACLFACGCHYGIVVYANNVCSGKLVAPPTAIPRPQQIAREPAESLADSLQVTLLPYLFSFHVIMSPSLSRIYSLIYVCHFIASNPPFLVYKKMRMKITKYPTELSHCESFQS